jgi:hypothetical protein
MGRKWGHRVTAVTEGSAKLADRRQMLGSKRHLGKLVSPSNQGDHLTSRIVNHHPINHLSRSPMPLPLPPSLL